jgi:hypothetical protein
LLGFEWASESILRPLEAESIPTHDLRKPDVSVTRTPAELKKAPAEAPARHTEPKWTPCTIETEPSRANPVSLASLFTSAQPLPPAGVTEWSGPPFEALFEPGWIRSIITGLLATSREGKVDLDRLLEQLARHEALERLPRLPWPTLRRGARVLVDVSQAMTPFAEDQRWLLGQIRRIAGHERTHVQRFIGCPARGVASGLEERTLPWDPSPTGTPVLLLTDLGANRWAFPLEGASEQEWIDFALGVRRAGCPLIALTPQAPDRFSPRLRNALLITGWDRRTTAGRLQRRIGRAHRIA